jgi:hypothetical protein
MIVFTPCAVPWWVSPSMSGLTLTYAEPDPFPLCRVVFGGGRLDQRTGQTDDRRIELEFLGALEARVAPLDERRDWNAKGYQIHEPFTGRAEEFSGWLRAEWARCGICPVPNFYSAVGSHWRSAKPVRHYLIEGAESYVEVQAQSYAWREMGLDYRSPRRVLGGRRCYRNRPRGRIGGWMSAFHPKRPGRNRPIADVKICSQNGEDGRDHPHLPRWLPDRR